ncbi:hypothetical protein O6H91_17G059700 [Diphasiastrum complanatum]|uniref:Uncharacterized protein n=1 Tax=Diphasiastrum complanatum TaxID=34168 RepID=A0ACC2B7A4_DIPCM|nr:hypothetical protein O6H91_17G059700 [Diphasiastrum complanatum]
MFEITKLPVGCLCSLILHLCASTTRCLLPYLCALLIVSAAHLCLLSTETCLRPCIRKNQTCNFDFCQAIADRKKHFYIFIFSFMPSIIDRESTSEMFFGSMKIICHSDSGLHHR